MTICFIDCSPFIATLIHEHGIDASGVSIHVGDPAVGELASVVGRARVVINGHTMMDGPMMESCPDLKGIVFLGTGAASYIDLDAAAKLGIAVQTVKGYGDRSIAEHAFALALVAARNISRMDRDLRAGIWDPLDGIELKSRNMGVIGAGGIGSEMVEIARGFGMRVLLWNRTRRPEFAEIQTDIETLLAESDIVSLHLSLSEETRGFLAAPQFARMKRGAILVNTARGAIINEADLLAALASGETVAHAALDVFDTEPLDPTSPLLANSNVTLSAHAGFKTREATERLVRNGLELARGLQSLQ
ncbi:2-hydroxyacid dehydrogenase [Aerobium aerolatum]|uniref:D-3-phosphoglycerate dehydrogenase n=1 Tax=Aquamicrobium aerolatum DSM 21857 TaxID=1121003 RepID=A0A1I3R8J5_9HYPH|nr:NAD(P)-dependent oxidoreductase [Aquamicrobium aerolatum]SFJ41969.1 D-3-phosphoglycerate dehydrogenase [Aquamicrobium aerolatum DSM 21857]